ncbi:MAG: 3-oxoacyl-ACP reductase FabG [Candidatus Omnitrophica bacterium]|nr:3-oxoacyl-ACP reductase FabG [Candidatus Omnitrophota bacterium]
MTKKRIALVVGGSRGIGKAIARELAGCGFDIWLTYKSNQEAAQSVRKDIEALKQQCELFSFDVSSHAETKNALADKCDETAPYAVVFNAGITRDNLLMWTTKEEWNDVIATNLNGFYNVMHVVLFSMLKEKQGRIIAISSTAGEVGQAGQVNYSASKAGLIGACKALAREVGKKNIYVNVVSPGFIETDMTKKIPHDKILPLIPLARVGSAEDVASIVGYLCSEKNMYIHGQVIGVNGGLAT